ncbi:MAG: hypothetical protein OXG85_13825 [Chloroflexi bacterium]|nr:hypothetical protein [Chloroflexota bacterium]
MAVLRRLTTERSAKVIVFLLIFAMASRVSVDPDLWWHLRLGEYILETGSPVYADVFSHTRAGQAHKNHSWLSQVVMFGIWRLAGHLGLTLFVSSLATAGMIFLYRAGAGTIYMRGFALVIGAACAAAFWSPRPQMFTFLFSSVLVFILFELKYKCRDHLWSLPLLFVCWVNLHGGFIIGLLILGAFLLGECVNAALALGNARIQPGKLRKLLMIAPLSLAVMPINPLGIDVFAVPFDTAGIGGLRKYIQEWQPPDFSQPYTWGFVALLLLALGAKVASRRRADATEHLLVGGALGLALFSGRNLSLFTVAALPVATIHINDLLIRRGWLLPFRFRSRETPGRAVINVLLICLVALGVLTRVLYVSSDNIIGAAVSRNWPADAARFLNASALEGRLFNSYNWGGYLIFSARDFPVFIDGRTDLYRDFLDEYAAAYGGEAWRAVFKRWDIDVALIESASPLAGELEAAPDWLLEYADEIASIYMRAPA